MQLLVCSLRFADVFSVNDAALQRPLAEMISLAHVDAMPNVEVDAYREKVNKTFFSRGRLTKIPAQLKKQRIVLEKIVEEFEPEREYTERDVNIILLDFKLCASITCPVGWECTFLS